jgi:hypothetical protein
LEVGDRVEAFDADEELSFVGVVTEAGSDFAYLRMEWAGILRNEPGQTLSVSSFGATPIPMPATAAESGDGGVVAATSSINPRTTSFVTPA